MNVETPVPRESAEARLVTLLRTLPSRAVGWYLLIGTVWIVASDLLVAVFGSSTWQQRIGEMAKGLAFIFVTSALLWFILRRLSRAHDERTALAVGAQQQMYETVLRTSADIIAIFSEDGRIRYVNDAVTVILGWEPSEMIGRPGREFVDPVDQAAATGFVQHIAETGRAPAVRRTFRMLHRDGMSCSMEANAAPLVRDGQPQVVVNGAT